MERINIFGKQELLSDEDRKKPFEHGCDYFTFKTCVDLSQGVKVIPYGNGTEYSINSYSQDLASFIVWWSKFVLKDLNGFSGFSHVKFELIGFELV
jgi:hypothetical protein